MPWDRHALRLSGAALAVALTGAACGSSNANNTSNAGNTQPANGGASTSTHSPSTTSFDAPSGTVSLSETGSTLLYPLFELWGPAYHSQHANISTTAQGTGSGTGISDAAAGSVNIGASDAYLSQGQVAAHPGLLNVALAISAQDINYNLPQLSGTQLKLDGTVLARMYSGKITTWNDPAIAALNPGVSLPATRVVPLHRSDSSGDTFLFTQYLTKQDPGDWGKIGFGTSVAFPSVPGQLGEQGNGGMVSGCAATPGCVAYIGISYLDKAIAKGLGYAQLKNGSGSYELPTATTIRAEAAGFSNVPRDESISLINGAGPGGYPIVNFEYAIVSKTLSGDTAQAVKAFLAWAMDPSGGSASTFLNKVHFQPLPAPVHQASLNQLSAIGS